MTAQKKSMAIWSKHEIYKIHTHIKLIIWLHNEYWEVSNARCVFEEGRAQHSPRCAIYINSALCNSAVKLSYCICRQCIFSPYLHLIWNVYLLYFYCFYNYCGDTFSALGHKGRCRPHARLGKKYAPLERSNQCNICIIPSFFLSITTKSSLKYFFESLGIFWRWFENFFLKIFLCLAKNISVQHLNHNTIRPLYHDRVLMIYRCWKCFYIVQRIFLCIFESYWFVSLGIFLIVQNFFNIYWDYFCVGRWHLHHRIILSLFHNCVLIKVENISLHHQKYFSVILSIFLCMVDNISVYRWEYFCVGRWCEEKCDWGIQAQPCLPPQWNSPSPPSSPPSPSSPSSLPSPSPPSPATPFSSPPSLSPSTSTPSSSIPSPC